MSVHTWGESPHGQWLLEIRNDGRYMGKLNHSLYYHYHLHHLYSTNLNEKLINFSHTHTHNNNDIFQTNHRIKY